MKGVHEAGKHTSWLEANLVAHPGRKLRSDVQGSAGLSWLTEKLIDP